ncbi:MULTISPECIES: DUF2891 domain-containing protein [Streptomyces]|uniref:DUF2891 domain-containing protein n=1 Tax=Streptomyces coelicolor (strain ATCC BAA-471 / A3(2) / M145) TaxID=100226 RepID=Q9RL49_STRCO|nr:MULTISPECIES: DUF2891 domain-containing protein [Streptomyces]MDX2925362.1 DUF2891 domain-containing protein [Streptomyces sp. NRRL_B-16638]MDX3316384.1 DUF2891 domain-containing protein [Streptomyces sp. ME03-5684b]MDX3405413.1 DUF2891 domain-containing protein [Streptomyces sp. ME02-6977A]MYU39964.1 DUF2891 family protein [Streptomyces sp. SID7813]NSL82838.1 DUF2891 domain-containing protein [Streptomyces coelicolor]
MPLSTHAARFAQLALANITREYPNFPAHLITSADERPEPRSLHPAFYGAYDWHSSVHMHWLLVRLLRRHGGTSALPGTEEAVAALDRHLTPGNLATEAAYLRERPSFERPYGWAWLLALAAECRALGGPEGQRWAGALEPAVDAVDALLADWLPKATYPVRHGNHPNSAFALGLALDSGELPAGTERAVRERLLSWFADDHDAPAHWEPSGQDFLSPALTEADAMRRVLAPDRLARWLDRFLPGLGTGARCALLEVPVVSDHADPQIGHLLGLTLSRAAALRALADALPDGPVRARLDKAAGAHLTAGLPAVERGDFTTDHWLATFAALALDPVAPPAPRH